jgi:taurine--2-oxoglutarate transaminase
MTTLAAPRRNLLLPWTVQEREDPVLEFDRGEGVYFFDRQGRRYLDFLSQLFHGNLGHGNRRVIEAIQRQAEQALCVSPQVVTEGRVALAAELTRRTPGDLNKCFFVNSGSEADDQAFILARLITGRPKIFAKYRSYHGTTLGGLSVGGDPRRSAIEPGPAGTVRFFDPHCYRCDFGLEYPACRLHCADALERQLQLENPATVAAVVVEPGRLPDAPAATVRPVRHSAHCR